MKYPGEDFFRRLNPNIRRAEEPWEEQDNRRPRVMRVRWYFFEGQHVQAMEGRVVGTFRKFFRTWLLVALDDGELREVKASTATALV